jgi:hypothetical protein
MSDENAQKIRLQILYGDADEWASGNLSTLIPKVGELCVDYNNASLKVGNGEDTWSQLQPIGNVSYYNSNSYSVRRTVNQLQYIVDHDDGDSDHRLILKLPIGNTADKLAIGNHTHSVLQSNILKLNTKQNSCGIDLTAAETVCASIRSNYDTTAQNTTIHFNIYDVANNSLSTQYILEPKPKSDLVYHIATVEEMQPVPDIQYVSCEPLRLVTSVSTGKLEYEYKLTLRIMHGTIQENDQIELCNVELSTRKQKTGPDGKIIREGYRKHRLRAQARANLVRVDQDTYTCTLTTSDLYNCYKFPQSSSIPVERFSSYPVYMRIRRLEPNSTIYSKMIPVQLHRHNIELDDDIIVYYSIK